MKSIKSGGNLLYRGTWLRLFLLFIFNLLYLLSGNESFAMAIDTPIVKAGTAKITGRIISPNDTKMDSTYVNLSIPHPISGEIIKYKALVDRSGKFSIDVDVETNISITGLSTSLNRYKFLLLKLTSGGVTNVDLAYTTELEIKNIEVTPAGMTTNDMTRSIDIMNEIIELRLHAPTPIYNKSADYFLDRANAAVSEKLEILNKDTTISKAVKGFLSGEFRLYIYTGHVFDYDGEMRLNYRNSNVDKSKDPIIQKIDRSYFHFLKDFKLNDPQYLYSFEFLEFQKAILQNDLIGLPEIGESDIPSWLAKVKVILSQLVGFDDGPYYDVLAANAYGRQLSEEVRPLTEKQKQNIAKYWKKGEIAKILMRKNKEVVELDKFKSPVVVSEISSIPDDKVMETIVSKHPGKVVFIDLWATWCGPCLAAMQQFRSTKSEFHDKDVAFVYITNGSSPRKLWEDKIKGIGSEHYYLTASQWEYMMNHFEFEGIPSYLLYNKESKLINKFTAFPGSDKVKAMINGLL
jgi:thiol-disulfide isomerase/thioredoxin